MGKVKPRQIFFYPFFLFLFLWGAFSYIEENRQIQQIDQQIEELREAKEGYEAKALRHEDQAERLQFEDKAFLEARRHLELAAENRKKAAKIQENIDLLQAEREQLLRKGK